MKTGGKVLIGTIILAIIIVVILMLKKKKESVSENNTGTTGAESTSDTAVKDVYGTGSTAVKNVLTTAAGKAVSLAGNKRQDKKSVKDYLQSTVASKWRQTWKDWKKSCKDFAKSSGGKKSQWRQYMEAWITRYHPEVDATTWKDMPTDPEDSLSASGEESNGTFYTSDSWNRYKFDTIKNWR